MLVGRVLGQDSGHELQCAAVALGSVLGDVERYRLGEYCCGGVGDGDHAAVLEGGHCVAHGIDGHRVLLLSLGGHQAVGVDSGHGLVARAPGHALVGSIGGSDGGCELQLVAALVQGVGVVVEGNCLGQYHRRCHIGGSAHAVGLNALDCKGHYRGGIGTLYGLDAALVQRVGSIELHAAGNGLGVGGRSHIAPEHVGAVAVDLGNVGVLAAVGGAVDLNGRVVDELAVGNLQVLNAIGIAAVGLLELAQCNAVHAWNSSVGIFLHKHVVVAVFLVEIGCLDECVLKHALEVLGLACTAVGIDVGIGEAQQAQAVELLGHPVDALAVLLESASDRTP